MQDYSSYTTAPALITTSEDSNTLDVGGNIFDTYFPLISVVVSILTIVLFSSLERCTSNEARQSGCCKSRIFPVDLLDDGECRFGYAAAFGSTASTLLSLFINTDSLVSNVPDWSKSIVILLFSLLIGLIYYPLFHCLTTPWVFLGSIIGFVYSGIWFYYSIKQVIDSPDKTNEVVLEIPVLLCLLVLMFIYAYRFTIHAKDSWQNSSKKLLAKEEKSTLATVYNKAYVQQLFHKNDKKHNENLSPQDGLFRQMVSKWVYKNDPTFRYSTRIVCILTVAIICAYQLGSEFILFAAQSIEAVRSLSTVTDATNVTESTRFLTMGILQFKLLIDVIAVSIIISFVIASLMTLYSIYKMMVSYRTNLLAMFRGEYGHLPFNCTNRKAEVILSDSLDFAGSQVAYILWGYLIIFAVLLVIIFLLTYVVILPIAGKVPADFFYYPASIILPPYLILMVKKFLKKWFCKRVLLETRISTDEKDNHCNEPVLALKNRKTYHNASYYLFFFYVVLGVIGCLVTIMKSIALGVFYLARLDRCSLCQGFETWDRGYVVYLSFLYVEASHRHPVVLVFCDTLLREIQTDKLAITMKGLVNGSLVDEEAGTSSGNDKSTTKTSYNKIFRLRWLKAYTLVRNPCLVHIKQETASIADEERTSVDENDICIINS